FESIYRNNYYSPSAVKRYSTSIESSIACTKNNKDHIDDYYEYMTKKNQAS
ncbi:45041_t:CDS:1, partial [Gigaspora margarita]